jgi:hypothetical protein
LDVNGDVTIRDKIIRKDDTDTFIRFPSNDNIVVSTNDINQIKVDNGAGDAGRVRVETQLHAGDLSSSNSLYEFHSGVSSIIESDKFLAERDLYVSGEILTQQISGALIDAGMLVYLETDGEWYPASASSIGEVDKMLGIALNTITVAGQELDVLIDGILNYIGVLSAHEQISDPATPGAPLYASTTSGFITEDAPSSSGNIVKIIGHNISRFEFVTGTDVAVVRFKPDNTWIEL